MSIPQYVVQGQPAPVAQPQQPIKYAPPGTQPAPPVVTAPTGGVAYYSATQQGVVLVTAPSSQPNYNYTPNDFMTLSIMTAILCGFFSPLTLALTIPAVLLSYQSQRNAKAGQINQARQQGMTAAYLNLAAITAALVVACICSGLVLGLYYGPKLAKQARNEYCADLYTRYDIFGDNYEEYCET